MRDRMDRKGKIARLEAWLKDNRDESFGFRTPEDQGTTREEFRQIRQQRRRQTEAVEHELQRQIDKKIIEELGLFDE